ncbi:sugar transferase [Pelagibacterium sp.]|uniref:sugar transferase n=1 Tax=Pelagibacterium sp. TaxID=1967288 RepID=UPI003BA86643
MTMTDHPAARPKRRKGGKVQQNRDLTHLTALGARTRRMRYLRDAATFLLPVLLTIALQALVYLLIYTRTGRNPWQNGTITALVLATIPIFSAFTLSAFRRNESPILAAVAVVAIYFSFAVSFLSAIRIPLSYSALAATAPIAMVLIAFANIGFHRSITARVGLIGFTGAPAVINLLGSGVALITDPDTDISQFDTILIDPTQHHTAEWSDMLARCYLSGVDIMPWTRFMEIRLGRVDVATFDLAHLAYSPSQLIYARTKRLLDVAFVLVTFLLTVPLAILTALYILARDGWPVLFIQHRNGFGGRIFRMYKFRTMYKGTGGGSTQSADKRVIPGCHLIRKLRLDELPQLYNILIGDMSLIGPRPVAHYVAKASERAEAKYALRTLVLPGITGWAQVTSGYAATTDEEITKLAYDLYYIKHLSFDLDLQILFKTVKTVLFGTGAR